MSVRLTWLSHGSWLIETADHRILLDPFLTDNPAAKTKAESLDSISHILVSHGHFDHVGDAAAIARRCGATLIANFEIAEWFTKQHGVPSTIGMNLGGYTTLPWGRIQLTLAWHSSVLPDGTYGGNPGGFLIEASGRRLYFACDTALFSDMQLITRGPIDAAILPIGDLFTMGPEESLEAIKLIDPARVLPAHYGTWPPIEQDAQAWAERVRQETSAEPIVLEVDETVEI